MSDCGYSPSTSFSYSYDETDVRISEVMSCGSLSSSTCDTTSAEIPSIPQCKISEDERSQIVDILKSPTPRTHFYVAGLEDSMIDRDTILRRLRKVPKLETFVVFCHPNILACLKKKTKARSPRSVVFDLCVFSPSYPVLVLTFTHDKYKPEAAMWHSAQLSALIEDVLKPYAKSDFSVVRGIIKEEDRETDEDFYKKVMLCDNDARLSTSLGSLALSMNQTKCVTFVSVFLDMLSAADQSQGPDSKGRTEGIPKDSDLSGADSFHEKSAAEFIAELRKEKDLLAEQVERLTVDNLNMQAERDDALRELRDGMKTEEELWLLLHNIGRNYPVHAWVNTLPVALQPGDEASNHSRHDEDEDEVSSTSAHDEDLTDAGAIHATQLVSMKSAMQTIDTLEGEYTYAKLKEENSNLRAENTGLKIDNAVLEKSVANALKMLNDLNVDAISTTEGTGMDVYADSQLQDEDETVVHSLSAKSTLLCKPHRFDKVRTNTDVCHIDDNGLLVNSASKLSTSASREGSALKMYYGACSTCSIPLEQRPRAEDHGCSAEYWEIETEAQTGENVSMRWRTVLEMGVLEQRYVDHHYWLYGRSRSWSMRVNYCNTHKTMCTQVWDEEHHISCQEETMSLHPNTTSNMKHGVVVDTAIGRVGFIDLELKKVLHKIDVKFLERLCPLFRVSTIHTNNVVKMKLVSGRDIEMTDEKRRLIHECLS